MDLCFIVRVIVIYGVCRIIGIFWEFILVYVIKMFFTILVREIYLYKYDKG